MHRSSWLRQRFSSCAPQPPACAECGAPLPACAAPPPTRASVAPPLRAPPSRPPARRAGGGKWPPLPLAPRPRRAPAPPQPLPCGAAHAHGRSRESGLARRSRAHRVERPKAPLEGPRFGRSTCARLQDFTSDVANARASVAAHHSRRTALIALCTSVSRQSIGGRSGPPIRPARSSAT